MNMRIVHLILCIWPVFGAKLDTDFSVDVTSGSDVYYYDPTTGVSAQLDRTENVTINAGINGSNIESLRTNTLKGAGNKSFILRRQLFRSNGCTCQELTCGCCLGLNLNQFNFNREGCMNFTYDPEEFAINMAMHMDGNQVFSNSISGKNPPPLCIPIPIPYIPLQVETCAKLYDIFTPGQNLHMCFDFETRIQRATVLVLQFDCMRMGNDGVALVKPGDVAALPPGFAPTLSPDVDYFDPVTEIKRKPNRGTYRPTGLPKYLKNKLNL